MNVEKYRPTFAIRLGYINRRERRKERVEIENGFFNLCAQRRRGISWARLVNWFEAREFKGGGG